jgi:signal transduction histidine kinase
VVLEVEADGPGIAEPDLPKVFQRFFTTRGEKRGTGLGLALVHAVVHAHGGRTEVLSPVRAGRGTTFRVTLPSA